MKDRWEHVRVEPGRKVGWLEALYFVYGVLLAFVVVATLTLLLSGCQPPSTGVKRPETVQRNTTVKITSWCFDDDTFPFVGLERSTGSGVVINEHEILTANHVVRCKTGAAVAMIEGFPRRPADIVWRDAEHDLARLRVADAMGASPARIGRMPVMHESVCASTGNPKVTYQCGAVTLIGGDDPHGDIRFDVVVIPGNSGSPLYNRLGELVGIVTQQERCWLPMRGVWGCGGRATSLVGRL